MEVKRRGFRGYKFSVWPSEVPYEERNEFYKLSIKEVYELINNGI